MKNEKYDPIPYTEPVSFDFILERLFRLQTELNDQMMFKNVALL